MARLLGCRPVARLGIHNFGWFIKLSNVLLGKIYTYMLASVLGHSLKADRYFMTNCKSPFLFTYFARKNLATFFLSGMLVD